MYQSFFGFDKAPFSLTPSTELFHGLAPHYEAIQTVMSAVSMGEGLIKVTGEVGTGKTMVCRMLINQLPEHIHLVYLPNPVLTGDGLRAAVLKELGEEESEPEQRVDAIQDRLLSLSKQGKQVVALIDEAQVLSDEALETLRLFGNLETEDKKLLQIVLFGQPELDERLAEQHMRQFRQRITFSASLRPLTLSEACAYIQHRLDVSQLVTNKESNQLFTLRQRKAIWKASRGIPRLINQICHKALILAFSQQHDQIREPHLYEAMQDTYDAKKPRYKTPCIWGWREQ